MIINSLSMVIFVFFQGKEIKATDLHTLSMPKDRLTIGKRLLSLRRHYPDDKVLRKMILEEF